MKTHISILFLAGLLNINPAYSSTAEEKEGLDIIAQDLANIQTEVIKLSRLRQIDDKEAFAYEFLVEDLSIIIESIKQHSKKPSRQLKKIERLKAEQDYGFIH